MGIVAGFIVGVLLGWLLSWILQKRLDDNLHDEVAKLQRQLADCEREKDKLTLLAPDAPAQIAEVAAAPAAAAAVATRSAEMELPAVTEAAVIEEVVTAETVTEEVVTEEAVTEEVVMEETVMEETAPAGEEGEATEGVVEVETATRSAVVDIDAEAPAVAAMRGDNLTVIKGIGPKFAEALTAAGIMSYADLAGRDPEQLQEIVQPAAWQKVDFEDWIAQAAALSRQTRRLQIGDNLTRIEGIGPTYAQKLRASGITTFADLANASEEDLAGIIKAPALSRADYPSWIAQAKLAAAGDEAGLQALQDQLNRREGDNIGLIAGIGGATLAALNNAGITTYAQLAASTPGELSAILSGAGVRRGNFDAWIAEAKQRTAGKRVSHGGVTRTRSIPTGATVSACPQDLDQIEGVGETYEQRLFDSGIGTFWEVSMLPQGDLSDILGVKAFQDVDLDALQASARRLAEETGSMGRVWDGTEPDDFEMLPGIGEVFERRLYEAGICTFAALAQLTEERLEEICKTHENFRVNLTQWIEYAREMSA